MLKKICFLNLYYINSIQFESQITNKMTDEEKCALKNTIYEFSFKYLGMYLYYNIRHILCENMGDP